MKDSFAARGFCAFQSLLSASQLQLLRRQCDDRRMAISLECLCEADCVLEALPEENYPPEAHLARSNSAAYLELRASEEADRKCLDTLLFSTLAAAANALLGGAPPRLFNEHFVSKPALGGPFRWHTDAAHQLEALFSLAAPERCDEHEYLSLWVALDDIQDENGPLLLLPLDAPQPPQTPWYQVADEATEAWLESHTAHLVTTSGLRAGDAVAFSSRVWHRSQPNTGHSDRRVFYAQYSRTVLGMAEDSPLALAIPTYPDASASTRATGRAIFFLPQLVSAPCMSSREAEAVGCGTCTATGYTAPTAVASLHAVGP